MGIEQGPPDKGPYQREDSQSQPPQQPPYGSYPPPRRGLSPAMWVLIGCGALVVLLAIVLAVCSYVFFKSPQGKDFMKGIGDTAECEANLVEIQGALDRFESAHDGDYPDSLDELVPVYLSDKSVLTCPAQERGAGGGYVYTKPKRSDPGSTVVIRCRHRLTEGMPFTMVLRKNGEIDQE